MKNPRMKRSIEYADNRISQYAAQYGRCAITGRMLLPHEIHCHHKLPLSMGGTDKYNNLIILDEQVHQLLHATLPETTAQYLGILQLTKNQLQKLNQLRKQANLSEIHC
ncbi:MAG: HNH endonuclease signature motif containing protein, partial [Cetobacterium sp.]